MTSRFLAVAAVSMAAAIAAAVFSGPFIRSRPSTVSRDPASAAAMPATRAAARSEPVFDAVEVGGRASMPSMVPKAGVPGALGTFIVVFREPALAAYRGGVPGIAVPKRAVSRGGRQRLDSRSPEAKRYASYLHDRQRALERRIATANRAPLPVRGRMQHALNGIVVDMTNAQAARVARMPEVLFVEPYGTVTPDSDVGPTHIGAVPVWNGSNPGAPAAYRGEGMVLGVIDTGVNIGSPSFAGVDPVDGYVHVNPLGAGNYLGTCAPGGADAGRCNNKLIGGYDMICLPPVSLCGQPQVVDDPGMSDSDGHGSHVASTAAGNQRDLSIGGVPRRISGVAPRANIVAFDICYYDSSLQNGSCPNTGIVAAYDKAVADGVIDVINYSFSGSNDPWGYSVAQAMLNAVSAGIFVSAGAGNSGPTAATVRNTQPWTATVAAAKHGRGEFVGEFGITGPNAVPAALTAVQAYEGVGSVPFSAAFPANTPVRASPIFNTTNDGCGAYTPGTFAGAIAIVRRGTCEHTTKVNNAAAAGAVAVVLANSVPGPMYPYTPGALRPTIGITAADGTAIWDFIRTRPTSTARIAFPMQMRGNVADALGDFSSRGPATGFDLIKPDLTAPGVSIVAASAGPTITGYESLVEMYDGTSMATPHVAGAALLIRQARPSWTPPEVLSALMMSSTDRVFLEDDTTPADPHARGAGRVRVDRAINAGLVLHESQANFLAANPATGGSPSSLNLAGMADGTCAGSCTFTRTFRNARTYGSLWRVQLVDLAGSAPTLLWVPAGGSVSLTLTIDTTSLPANGTWRYGKLVLTELFSGAQTNADSELQLPIGVVVPAAAASTTFLAGISKLPGKQASPH
ncbi:MAG: S8 family serine peptidase [Pseudomonadota bacterium]